MPDTEDSNLAQDFLSENPDILTDRQLSDIAQIYGLSLDKVRELAKAMSKSRAGIDPDEITPN